MMFCYEVFSDDVPLRFWQEMLESVATGYNLFNLGNYCFKDFYYDGAVAALEETLLMVHEQVRMDDTEWQPGTRYPLEYVVRMGRRNCISGSAFLDLRYAHQELPTLLKRYHDRLAAVKAIQKWWIDTHYHPRGPHAAVIARDYDALVQRSNG